MRFIVGIILTVFLWGTSFAEMISVTKPTAELKNTPSETNQYAILLYVPLYYPLQILDTKENFYKVSDFSGHIGWINKNDVGETASVVVKIKSANVRKGPGTKYEVAFIANQGVAFKVLDTDNDWLEVLHEDGKKGWIHKNIVWGFNPPPANNN